MKRHSILPLGALLLVIASFLPVAVVAAELIDADLAKKAALFYGAQRWGSASILDYQLFVDPFTDEPQVYVFTLHIGDGQPPGEQRLLERILRARRTASALIGSGSTSFQSNAPGESTTYGRGLESPRASEHDFDDLAAVVIGATPAIPPFISRTKGLPGYLAMREDRLGTASSVLQRRVRDVTHYVFLDGIVYGYLFDFGTEKVIIDDNLNHINLKDLHRRAETATRDSLDYRDPRLNSREAWDLLKANPAIVSMRSSQVFHWPESQRDVIDEGYIEGVPYYPQSAWGGNTCGPTAVGQVLGYWDSQYPNLVDWGNASFYQNRPGLDSMMYSLQDALLYNEWTATLAPIVSSGTEDFCNNPDFGNSLVFDLQWDITPIWVEITSTIDELKPMVFRISGQFHTPEDSTYNMSHYMSLVGYKELDDPAMKILVLHPNTGAGPEGMIWLEDFEINFDIPFGTLMEIWRVNPGGSDAVAPTCNLLIPNEGGTYAGSINVAAVASDASGIWQVWFQYSIDHETWHDIDTVNGPAQNWTTFFNSYGIMYDESVWVRARAMDNWGNYSAWDESDQSFAVDNQGPQPTSIAVNVQLDPASAMPNGVVNVSGSAMYDTGQPVAFGTAEIVTSGNSWTAPLNSSGQFDTEINAPDSPGSSVSITVYVSDGTLTGSAQTSLYVQPDGQAAGLTLYRSAMCEDVDDFDPYDPINETHWFRSTYEAAICWAHLTDVTMPFRVRWYWYKPDGSQPSPGSTETEWLWNPSYDWWKVSSGWYVDGSGYSDLEGRHNVNIYVEEQTKSWEYMESQYFIISYDFKEHMMCKDVQGSDPWDPIEPTNVFHQTDDRAVTWARFTDVAEACEVRTEWYEPNGSFYDASEYTIEDPGEGFYYEWAKQWNWTMIDGYSAENKCGTWQIKHYERDPWDNWDLLYTDNFAILESPNVIPQVSILVSPTDPFEQQNISVQLEVSDNTYLKDVTLYWNDGTQHSYSWSDVNAASLSETWSIGIFAEGTSLEIYARARDTSENENESSRHSVLVLDSDTEGPIVSDLSIVEYGGDGDGVIEADEQAKISCGVQDVSGVAEVHFYVDDSEVPLGGVYLAVVGPYASGLHGVMIAAVDSDNSPAYTTVYDDFVVLATDTVPPSIIDDLRAAMISPDLVLRWSVPTDNVGVDGYRVYRHGAVPSEGQLLAQVTGGQDSTYTVRYACGSPITNYFYDVRATDAAENMAGSSNLVGEFDYALGPYVPAPAILVDPAFLQFSIQDGGVATRELLVTSVGDTTLVVTSVMVDAAWLSASPTSFEVCPGSAENVVVICDATGLVDSTYAATLTIGSNDPYHPSIDIGVSLNVASQVPEGGLAAYYPFNGNADDESGNGHHCTLGGPVLVPDRFGTPNSAYSFDGINDWMKAADFHAWNDSITMAVWVKANQTAGVNPFVDKHGEMFLLVQDGTTRFYLNPVGTVTAGTAPSIGEWHFVVGTYDGVSMRVYVDGVQEGYISGSGDISNSTYDLYFASDQEGVHHYLNGCIDDIRFYDRVLSDGEVTVLYHEGGWTGPSGGLVAYYPFSGDADDASGNGNDGATYGPAPTYDRAGNANSAYRFDGAVDYIEVPAAEVIDTLSEFSISVWTRPEAWADGQSRGVVSKKANDVSNGWVIYNDGYHPDRLNLRMKGDSGEADYLYSSGGVTVGGWQHWVVTSDLSSVRWYRNASPDATYSPPSVGVMVNTEPLHIGHSQSWNGYFAGVIDEVRIYSYALDESEIQGLFWAGGGYGQDISIAPSNLQFSLVQGESGSKILTVSNTGDMTLEVNSITDDAEWLNESLTSFGLSPGESRDVTVTANTSGMASGSYNATIFIESNDPDSGTLYYSVTLSIDSGMVAYYPFDGDMGDESGHGNHGMPYGATLTTDRFGVSGKAAWFDGIDDYVEVPDSPSLDFDGYFTIMFWLRPDSWDAGYIPVLSKMLQGSTYGFLIERFGSIYVSPTLQLVFHEPNHSIAYESNGIPSPGVWEHWAVVFAPPTNGYNPLFKWYRNGVLDATRTSFPFGDYTNDIPLLIGHTGGSSLYLHGAIDEVRIYSRTLSATEVSDIYQSESGG